MFGRKDAARHSEVGIQLDIKESLRMFIAENFLFSTSDNTFADDDSFLESSIIDSTGILA